MGPILSQSDIWASKCCAPRLAAGAASDLVAPGALRSPAEHLPLAPPLGIDLPSGQSAGADFASDTDEFRSPLLGAQGLRGGNVCLSGQARSTVHGWYSCATQAPANAAENGIGELKCLCARPARRTTWPHWRCEQWLRVAAVWPVCEARNLLTPKVARSCLRDRARAVLQIGCGRVDSSLCGESNAAHASRTARREPGAPRSRLLARSLFRRGSHWRSVWLRW